MQPASEHHIPDGLLASITLLSEKPRHGVTSRKSTLQSGIYEANSTAAIGLRFRCWETASGTVDAPNKDVPIGINIFNCPDANGHDPCANTWKQSSCVVNKPFNTVKDDFFAGTAGAAFFGGVAASGTGAGGVIRGVISTVGKEAFSRSNYVFARDYEYSICVRGRMR